jgi:signal transduction histidine kinase
LNWAAPIIDSNRNTKGAIVFNQDVSERVKAEHALRQSETELRALSLKLLTAQEEERKRIARELHDSTSSSLAGIKYYLEAFISDPEAIPPCKAKLQQLLSFLEVAIQELRRIMTDLRPSVLDDLGLLATIDWFCRRLCSVYQSIHIEEEITVNENDVPEPLKIVIFRILQEAVNNAAKYSRAKRVNISLVRSHSVLQLTIADEGVGFDINGLRSTNLHGRGWGIIGMKERTELTGGTFSIESGSGCGTRVCARWLFDA